MTPPLGIGKTVPKVRRAERLVLSLASYSALEQESCTSLGQHSKVSPGGGGFGKPP